MAGPELTDEQQDVVDLAADTSLLVTAGAGAGKTHTMIERVARLIRDDELGADEVLVLSFARSAVRELTRRLDRAGTATRFVPISTFDSFALDILMSTGATLDWTQQPFDERIRAAAEVIASDEPVDRLDDLRHLVVDEAQDLVGDRLVLVEAILDRTGCAFTVVGDVAQSIYGFQIEDAETRLHSADACFRLIRERFDGVLVERELTRNFRAQRDEARPALPFGPVLRVDPTDTSNAYYEPLRDVLMGVPVVGDVDDDYALLGLYDEELTTAVLCRTNAETLVVSERLADAGVPHRLRRTAQDRVAPSWLAGLFRSHPGSTLGRDRLIELLPSVPGGAGQHVDTVWRQLRRVAGDRGRAVDMHRLRDAVARRRLPDEFTAQPGSAVVVSSFHRAKGLEFDRVVVVDPGPLRERSDTPEQEEARLLYVAMTRPRDDLWRMDPLRLRGVRRWDRGDRIGRYGTGRYRRNHFGLEIVGGDVFAEEPAGAHRRYGAEEIQELLSGDVSVGDEVELWFDPDDLSTTGGPVYRILLEGIDIGRTSDGFGTALFRFLGGHAKYTPKRYPGRIERVRIDAVETVAGSVASGERAGLGAAGVWLAPRLGGLSRFDWKVAE
ncbi:UvrD-helicase domain-containing protein [Pseudonocardia alni]|uniref:UvrD-helicase domain-containing protein n=1 Tax=Pseudonocardia alni TaxID=33907 RepID=UPI0033CA4608